MKIMFSAGEASGDMHAAAVAAEIRRICPDADMFGMGGSGMARAGVRIIYDIQNLGIIGVVEVIRHLPLFFRLRTLLREAMLREKPACPSFHKKDLESMLKLTEVGEARPL